MGALGSFTRAYSRLDQFQARHASLGFPLAVRQKYADDQGSFLAAAITYYAFFSIFPLLLVLTTVLGYLLRGHPHFQQRVVSSALGQFPVIGRELKVRSLSGSGLALGLGLGGALWAGTGALVAVQNAMNQMWGVSFTRRPSALLARARALLLLPLLGGGVLAATVLAGIGSAGGRYALGWKIGSIVASALLDFGLFWVGFRVLTAHDVSWSALRGGAAAAAVGYEGLQVLGGFYVGHVLSRASDVYGTFALVIGLLSFIYLAAHIGLLAAEGSVVSAKGLWPRSLSLIIEEPATSADRDALTQRAMVEERRSDEEIEVRVPVAESTQAPVSDPD